MVAVGAVDTFVAAVVGDAGLAERLEAAGDDDAKAGVAVEAGFAVSAAEIESIRTSLPWGEEIDDDDLTRGRPAAPWSMPPEGWRDAQVAPAR